MFTIEYTRDAAKVLKSMPKTTAVLIMQKVSALAADPFAPNNNVKKLVNRPECRLRVGDWRILYAVHEGKLVIEVIRIAPRGGAYQ
ncbi:MAG: type II toxin-antitoxin system RelE/ParE family toxin [Desulfobacteraceae bacterium]|nr:type II toxin-antitoxin system RelE/ParE family toxin [Desulfobacteraceae bacterium]